MEETKSTSKASYINFQNPDGHRCGGAGMAEEMDYETVEHCSECGAVVGSIPVYPEDEGPG